MKKILLLEDDVTLNNGIVMALKREEYQFSQCFTILEAKEMLNTMTYDMLILDINLPDGSGFELCQEVRKCSNVPIILLTARNMEFDVVAGLESGADDYITKPFSLMVLRARINVLFRRLETIEGLREYQIGKFLFNFTNMEFYKDNRRIELSKTEQKLLYLFVTNPNKTLSRDMILEQIWSDGAEYVEDNALSVTIRRLRDKLEEDSSKPEYIKTVFGKGYTWVNQI
ncbi:response regulator transcription factor [Anaeromicropila herbilytica]|uniref:Stage 0 sporulation protein A homolog n=1 Tax=Anaeromicropila herbilytica TaxID=2785025 RepID=A0A7R7IB93_9FIRM|nr:response regulator transcription factor [Anaeromicropila herbilytica]BCN29287.1 DNA-binding response regulator [Anaeromicropila herbilytica]